MLQEHRVQASFLQDKLDVGGFLEFALSRYNLFQKVVHINSVSVPKYRQNFLRLLLALSYYHPLFKILRLTGLDIALEHGPIFHFSE